MAMTAMKKIIREYMNSCPAFWFSYSNCWKLVDRLATENGIRLSDWTQDDLVQWMIKEL